MKTLIAQSFKDLILWQKAHQLTLLIYQYTVKFQKTETYTLTSQFRRAVISVPANIAECFKKRGKQDKLNYLNISQGSLSECEYYLILAQDLGYGENKSIYLLVDEVGKLITSYKKAITNSI